TLFDGKVTLLRSINSQVRSSAIALSHHVRLSTVARTFQRDQVCFRSAAGQNAKRIAVIAEQFAEPANRLRFNHRRGRAVTPCSCVLVERRAERVSPDANRQRRGIELTKVMRTRDLLRMSRYVACELIQNLFDSDALDGERLVEEL